MENSIVGIGGTIAAVANIQGSLDAPELRGRVYFTPAMGGVMVTVNITGLPPYSPASESRAQPIGPFGFHIHERSCDVGNPNDPYQGCGGHYNPDNQPHGNHAGDLPVIGFNKSRRAYMTFFTDRFNIEDIIGKSIIIHQNPDDYRSQPAGGSGKRIGHGNIELLR